MIRIGILGASGYTALELIKVLLRHPEAEIVCLTSRQRENPHVGSVHPPLAGRLDLTLENVEPATVASRCDCVFSCLPHATSARTLAPILNADTKVVDLSADYRLWNADIYAKWYGQKHTDPERLGQIAYGLPELYREKIENATIVSNPGCYPTSAILAMAPLLKNGLVRAEGIIFDSKSGVSGAGRSPGLTTHYPECNESIHAYNVGRHRHTPEIAQILSDVSGSELSVIFTPHLVPMDRGILTTGYAFPNESVTEANLQDALRDYYANCPFIRVVDHLPATKDVVGTNFCDITVRRVEDHVITISCLDNLLKGASGAAIQNMNLMFGLDETLAVGS